MALQSRSAPVISDTRDTRLTRRNEKEPPSRQGKGADHLTTGQYHTRTFINSSYKEPTGVTRYQAESCLISASHAKEGSKDTGREAIVW